MLLHFAELVQWELAAAEWVAAVVVEGKKTFLFFWIMVFGGSLSVDCVAGLIELPFGHTDCCSQSRIFAT